MTKEEYKQKCRMPHYRLKGCCKAIEDGIKIIRASCQGHLLKIVVNEVLYDQVLLMFSSQASCNPGIATNPLQVLGVEICSSPEVYEPEVATNDTARP